MIADDNFANTYFSLASANDGLSWEVHRCDDDGWVQIASIANCTQMNAELIVGAMNAACIKQSHRSSMGVMPEQADGSLEVRGINRQLQHAHSIIHDLFHFCEWNLQEPNGLDEYDLRELLFRSGLYLERYELDLCDSDDGP